MILVIMYMVKLMFAIFNAIEQWILDINEVALPHTPLYILMIRSMI